MKALVLGGNRHGEWIETLDGARMWVDIQNACRHVLRQMTWNITDAQGGVLEAYVLFAAVHEELIGPNEPMIADQLLRTITMNEFARAHGDRQEIPEEPAGAALSLPGDDGPTP